MMRILRDIIIDGDKAKKAIDNTLKYGIWLYMLLMGLFPYKELPKVITRTLYGTYAERKVVTRTLYGIYVERKIATKTLYSIYIGVPIETRTLYGKYAEIPISTKTLYGLYAEKLLSTRTLYSKYAELPIFTITLHAPYSELLISTKTLYGKYAEALLLSKTLYSEYAERLISTITLHSLYSESSIITKTLYSSYAELPIITRTLYSGYAERLILSRTLYGKYAELPLISRTLFSEYAERLLSTITLHSIYSESPIISKTLFGYYSEYPISTRTLFSEYAERLLLSRTLYSRYSEIPLVSKTLFGKYAEALIESKTLFGSYAERIISTLTLFSEYAEALIATKTLYGTYGESLISTRTLYGLYTPIEELIVTKTLYGLYTPILEPTIETKTLYGLYTPAPAVSTYEVTIDNSSNPNSLSDYQVLIKIDDPQFFSDTNNNRNAVRVYDEDKVTKLPYWIEEWDTSSKSAKIWVKVPNIPGNSTKKIYIVLDPSLTESEEDPESVFEFFDDFNGNALDTSKWSINYGNVVYTLGNSLITFTDADPYWVSPKNPDYGNQLKANFTLMDKMIIEMKIKELDQGGAVYPIGECGIALHPANKKVEVYNPIYDSHAATEDYLYGGNTFVDGTKGAGEITIEPETFYILQVIRNNSNFTLALLDLDYSTLLSLSGSTTAQLTYMTITIGRASGYPFTKFAVDWYRVRKYTEPEPTVSYVKL